MNYSQSTPELTPEEKFDDWFNRRLSLWRAFNNQDKEYKDKHYQEYMDEMMFSLGWLQGERSKFRRSQGASAFQPETRSIRNDSKPSGEP